MVRRSWLLSRQLKEISKRSLSQFKDASNVPLSQPLDGGLSTSAKPVGVGKTFRETKMTKLSNGVRVCSEPHFGDYCTIGVAIESGCRFESSFTKGVSHIVEKLAFGATNRFPSRDEIHSVLEKSGGIIDCQSTRDTFLYAGSCHVTGVDAVVEVLANAVWMPLLQQDEVEEAKMITLYEIEDMTRKIECEPLITDWIHQAAFKGNTLGFSKFATSETLPKITSRDVATYLSQMHSPPRMVVAGIGVDHDAFVTAVERHFQLNQATWNVDRQLLLPKVPAVDDSLAQYTGGEIRQGADLSLLGVGTPYPHLAHVVLGFQGCSFKDDDFVPFCVLQSLLGGGGSFSAGGPGKGMYARLYTQVMNRCHWIYSAVAQNHSYSDDGLFCIHASCPPNRLQDALVVVMDQFLSLRKGTDKQELERAKVQLKSHLMMNLEVRPVMFEDLARQVLGHGTRRRPDDYAAKIENVTNSDIIRIAERMLATKPSLVGYGELDKLQTYTAVDQAAAKRNVEPLTKPSKFFRFGK
ncbi:unnamed protein product [Caenorhabditis auriculariae]|uniref:Mitochondrial-processing peptidase subunit alpha n=1 Tax=Caenorhabditis auriculariae TaxID=2777116 RepID=A0A8S1GMU8_9PELO|nr:unnamed protein product [Caenorhabditis auriculariae]